MCRKYYDLELHEKQQAAKAAKRGAAAADDEVRPALGFAWFSSSAGVCVWSVQQLQCKIHVSVLLALRVCDTLSPKPFFSPLFSLGPGAAGL